MTYGDNVLNIMQRDAEKLCRIIKQKLPRNLLVYNAEVVVPALEDLIFMYHLWNNGTSADKNAKQQHIHKEIITLQDGNSKASAKPMHWANASEILSFSISSKITYVKVES